MGFPTQGNLHTASRLSRWGKRIPAWSEVKAAVYFERRLLTATTHLIA
ncbi:MAG: hypothetical protein NTZ28_04165 [Nitrospirae bacterium]|nr:hypothetical protein [Nitrospirota bacterium]